MQIVFKNIVKSFGATMALNDVSFTVEPGIILGLLGENGAGKSTLMNILGGVLPPTSGIVEIDGKEYESLNSKTAFDLGIGFIHQELNLINDLKVYENLFLNHELTKNGLLDKKAMIKRSKEVFDSMNIKINPEDYVKDIDTSRQQIVEIAKAILYDSKVIIFDEPTTALTDKEIKVLFEIMREFKEKGISSIYISHKMPEIFEICDQYVVLRDGKFIQEGSIADIDENIATELLVGKKIDVNATYVTELESDEEIFSVQDITCEPHFRDISFSIRKGEVIAITGLFGDGRGVLSEALFGVKPLDRGIIKIKGQQQHKITINRMIQNGVSMVPRDRKERSIIKDLNISNNLSMSHFNYDRKKQFISERKELDRYNKNKSIFNIKAESPHANISSLSGGNQQKVIFARWFEIDSDIYILDNPTQGIDVGSKDEIYELIVHAAKQGKGLVVFTSEVPEIQKIANRCIVMYKGEINKILDHHEINEVDVMYYSTGANKKENHNGRS